MVDLPALDGPFRKRIRPGERFMGSTLPAEHTGHPHQLRYAIVPGQPRRGAMIVANQAVTWLASDEIHLRRLGDGLARFRHEDDPSWMWRAIEANGALEVELLLTQNVDKDGIEVLRKPVTGTDERIEVLRNPSYVRGMLNQLGAAEAPTEALAVPEWWYNPALRHERTPSAFTKMLAQDPELFGQPVCLIYDSDSHPSETVEGDSDEQEVASDHEAAVGGGTAITSGESLTFADTLENRNNALDILSQWRRPLPASTDFEPPETRKLKDWVDRARAATDQVEGGMSLIGEALSGLVLGTDGAWPCQAIRELLEHENDPLLESGLLIGRLNGRGATTRTA